MKAWLVVNDFLNQKKFDEIHQWLREAGEKKGVEIEIRTNATLMTTIQGHKLDILEPDPSVDFILFWDKDVVLAKALELLGYPVFNSSFGIEACDNKSLTHIYLAKENIPMPDTVVAPMTYGNIGYTDLEFLAEVEVQLGYPVVVKECYGSFGQQVYLCRDALALKQIVKKLQGSPLIFQKYVKEAQGKDVRLQVVGEKVVAAMERTAKEGDFRANITNGGTMKTYVPSYDEIKLAIKCCKILKVDFAGVDIIHLADGSPLVIEVNSNAHFKNIYDCTGVNTAECIMEYLIGKSKPKMCNRSASSG